ncbi:MAG: ABC transporter permease [Lachnospiraceae bacterium]|nr:ABC transporter permease [Lachnospiraceae bacterium]MBO5485110.1 ABC transporter permease [Lachnospiraceae bacterium]
MSKIQEEFIRKSLSRKRKIIFCQILLLVLLIGAWELTTRIGILDSFIFSSPSRIGSCFLTMVKERLIFYHIGITLGETFLSFFLVIIIGILLAILLWWNEALAKVLEPYLVVLNSLPKTALAPVFIVWLGNNMKTIIVAAVSVAVFSTTITLYNSFQEMEPEKIKLIQTLGGKKKDILCKLILPGNIPAIISIMKVDIGLTLVGVIIGEFLAAKAGLGYLIVYGSQVFKLDYVLLSIVILCLISTGLYLLISLLEKICIKHYR